MKIQEKITITVALTLFFVIFITVFSFTQLFLVNNRNIHLYDLAEKNNKFTGYIAGSYSEPQKALDFLSGSDYMERFEDIAGVKIIIADTRMNIIINNMDLESEDFKNLMLSSREIKRFFNITELLTISNRQAFGKLMVADIKNSRYYISIKEFRIKDTGYLSIFLKKQTELVLPPLRYALEILLIFLLAGLISIITGLILGKNISNPILRLNRSVSRISNGDYSENIRAKGTDEIGVLARNFNIMKNKIERSQESLKDFTYMLSHEIKNMITSINGYAVGITEGVYSSEAEINEALDIIKSKSKDLENITESLLMLSRIENRIIDISREDVDFEKIINDLLKLYEPELGKNMQVIKKTFDIKPGTRLLSDKYLIQTVVSNLINNAIKYSTAQSEIAINAMSDEKSIIIAVSNSGHSISEEEKDKIFNMFYRSEKYEFKNIKGFGLGLAISRRIANILGADLDFNSNENINTFTFKIPFAS